MVDLEVGAHGDSRPVSLTLKDGTIHVNQADGQNEVTIGGDNSGAGLIQVANASGNSRVDIDGESGGGGEISLKNAFGNTSITLNGEGTDGGDIRISTCTERGFGVVTVADTGTGTAPDDLPDVLERFYRGDKSRTRPSPMATR